MFLDLNKIYTKDIIIDETIDYDQDYYCNTAIKKLDTISVKGKVLINDLDEMHIILKIDGDMYLEDAIDLDLIKYPIAIDLEEVIDLEDEFFAINNNKLDLKEFVWKNIVLEIPIRITNNKKEQIIEDEGWSLNKPTTSESVFNKLNDLFKN